jgi:hypothetical protein
MAADRGSSEGAGAGVEQPETVPASIVAMAALRIKA